jgi:hypothetical protein
MRVSVKVCVRESVCDIYIFNVYRNNIYYNIYYIYTKIYILQGGHSVGVIGLTHTHTHTHSAFNPKFSIQTNFEQNLNKLNLNKFMSMFKKKK